MEIKDIISEDVSVEYKSTEELDAILEDEIQRMNSIIAYDRELLDKDSAEAVRIRFLGKKSPLQSLLKSFKNLPANERKVYGQKINLLKKDISLNISEFLKSFESFELERKLSNEKFDHTLPLPQSHLGTRHPVSVVLRDLLKPFERMGFSVVDGPELEHEFYNFEALNIKKDHPAREMQDTFFLSSEWVLRTHTSNVQVHALKERGVPLKIVCPGCVYRNEYDLTHAPSFRQIECLVVDEGIHMGHLKFVINELLNEAFQRDVKVRFRSSYFPFTEPSAEVDVQCQQCFGKGCRSCKQTGWSEIGGCGVVNVNVLKSCGIDPKKWQGIAFGFGVERIAKDRFGIADLRLFYDGQLSFLDSFSLI